MICIDFNIYSIHRTRIFLWILFSSIFIVSCSHNGDLHSALESANEKFSNKDFDDAQSELLKAEALITSHTPIQEKERLERLKGMNYLELRVMDKAKASLQKALDYSKHMNDTSLIIQNSFNLGLCNSTIDEAIEI